MKTKISVFLFFSVLVACVSKNHGLKEKFPLTKICSDLPDDIKKDLPRIINYRFGVLDDSDMLTTEIRSYVEPNGWYRFKPGSLTKTKEPEILKLFQAKQRVPRYLEIKGDWASKTSYAAKGANVLGDFGTFWVNESVLNIPLEVASEDNLAYYNSRFVKKDGIVQIRSKKNLPVSVVRFDPNYVEGYLSRPKLGGGFYLEVHDAPHFWSSLNKESRGFVVLGKKVGESYHLTAYSIPYGVGIYTAGGTIHYDGSLIGEQFVIYTVTPNFSTVHVKNKKGNIVSFKAV